MKTYVGSSKNVHLLDDEFAIFEFTDRYSIFDWGEMPDQLEQKGLALANMATAFFKLIQKAGIKHHFVGLCDAEGNLMPNGELSRFTKVKRVAVHHPPKEAHIYNYEFYQTRPTDCLVPLEVIFRLGAPTGSSLLARYPELKGGERFSKPLVEFTTKLEAEDRLLPPEEARAIAGITRAEMDRLTDLTIQVADILKDALAMMNVELWDGKLEWAFHGPSREFMLVDAIGLDEIRASFMGHTLSKEFLRQHYRDATWTKALKESKKLARESGGDFHQICREQFKQTPEKLPAKVKSAAQSIYTSFSNELSVNLFGSTPFGDVGLSGWVREHT